MNAHLLVEFIRDQYQTQEFVPLHAPTFAGNEKAYVIETIDSTFVSSVGKFVDEFERKMEAFTGSARAVATVNGTAALHAALYMAGVERGDLVITQALTFVATCNALYHMGAEPIFVDVSPVSMGLCPKAANAFLEEHAQVTESGCIHKQTGRRIKAVVPMHTFGHPVELDELVAVCLKWNITLVEDAAESLGSFYKDKHTGTLGEFGAVSFNGNKIITTGGGGMVLCGTEEAGRRTKHVTTTAKVPHPYEFFHDEPGFNYRMPNLNAALGCAQMEVLERYLAQKRQLAHEYQAFFAGSDVTFVVEPEYAQSNYWLNAIICADAQQRNELLEQTNAAGVMTRPIWQLMHRLPMFEQALRGDLTHSEFIEAHLINLPSTPVGA
ncbi:LegC family aminotransferase [Vibrio metschnikovii]|uniref:LegC family aminotransferase n=1 Tax=bacterium 19PA01SH03 TaxID=2920705 RepID=A0AAU6SNE3_UNCXX|nr:LegC family aminotransferase [Vibrio metschnikovii]EKO3663866.1 LegC family aminotransferase [Vibrio metschnikovii]EKO3733334.1 LegC family aminotransferase [Vibrio metschnikovii]EKO3753692.1 LegC family aminotransferase [Vibrio metschnikovii]EKO3902319.1 LegC family aminotransferase [Vibrio metschnikovii]